MFLPIVAGNRERYAVPRTGFVDSETDSGTAYGLVQFDRGNSYLYCSYKYQIQRLTTGRTRIWTLHVRTDHSGTSACRRRIFPLPSFSVLELLEVHRH